MNSAGSASEQALDLRSGLPDSLRILLEEYPRQGWEADPAYNGLISFWLDRHMMFRRILEKLHTNAVDCRDGNTDPKSHVAQLARFGSMFVGELHGHHNIEDVHYFPLLAKKDARIKAGFDLLDSDHHALDGHLNKFVERANAVLQPSIDPQTALGRFLDNVQRLERLLDRHLVDEEEVVVPVILKYGVDGLN
ncbi:MAG: hemerythrin domain-containing protein [Pseudomonadota bacterium]